jgi:[ribosomal protein S5]-alanine N-acetyltransferase
MHYPTLYTDRLILRPFQRSDGPRVQLLAGDELVAATTLNLPHPYTEGLAEEWIATHEDEFIQRKSVINAICLKEDEKLIGAIGLMLKPEHDLGELGYWIGVPYWNNGYCTEACKAVMEYGFMTFGLNKIFANYFEGNEASGKVMKKLGMQYEARLRQHVKHWGKYKDLVTYGMLREEFLAQKGQN